MACVSDSYNIWNACEKVWGEQLKEMVVERGKNGGTLVVRPDSGDPPEVVVKVSTNCINLASYFIKIIWCSPLFCKHPPPPILRLCIALFVVAEGWLLFDIGGFVLFLLCHIQSTVKLRRLFLSVCALLFHKSCCKMSVNICRSLLFCQWRYYLTINGCNAQQNILYLMWPFVELIYKTCINMTFKWSASRSFCG